MPLTGAPSWKNWSVPSKARREPRLFRVVLRIFIAYSVWSSLSIPAVTRCIAQDSLSTQSQRFERMETVTFTSLLNKPQERKKKENHGHTGSFTHISLKTGCAYFLQFFAEGLCVCVCVVFRHNGIVLHSSDLPLHHRGSPEVAAVGKPHSLLKPCPWALENTCQFGFLWLQLELQCPHWLFNVRNQQV